MKPHRVIDPINTDRGGQIAQTILAGYYKFGAATILKDFNGATAVMEYETYNNATEPNA